MGPAVGRTADRLVCRVVVPGWCVWCVVSQVRLITAEKVVGLDDTAVRWVGLVVDGAAAVVTDEVASCRVVAGCVDVSGCDMIVVFSVAVVCACVVGLCVVIGCVVGLCIISGCVVGRGVVVGLCVVTSGVVGPVVVGLGVVGLCVVTGCVVPIAVSCLLAVV